MDKFTSANITPGLAGKPGIGGRPGIDGIPAVSAAVVHLTP
jgi:hypothetical protein